MPPLRVNPGNVAYLDAIYRDGNLNAVDPVSPLLTILDPDGTPVETGLVPVRDSIGLYHYNWPVPLGAELGVWTAHWTGVINGLAVEADDLFAVVAAGLIDFPVTGTAGPCEAWEPIWCCDLDGVEASVTGNAVAAATEVLWALGGRQHGYCTVELRPCRDECFSGVGDWWPMSSVASWPYPAKLDGAWVNLGCTGGCIGGCSCTSVESVTLPSPVASVLQVVVDGVALPSTAYRVDDQRRLIRQDGGSWPTCQDLSKPLGEPGTWSIIVRIGQPVPMIGRFAVGELACEFVAGCADPSACHLPRRIVDLARQGLSIRFTDLGELTRDGLLGLTQSDLYIRFANPNRLSRAARIFSPDKSYPVRG